MLNHLIWLIHLIWVFWFFFFSFFKSVAILKSIDFDFHCHGSQKCLSNQILRTCNILGRLIGTMACCVRFSWSHLAIFRSKHAAYNGYEQISWKKKPQQMQSLLKSYDVVSKVWEKRVRSDVNDNEVQQIFDKIVIALFFYLF